MYDKCIELEPDNATTYVHKGYDFFFFLIHSVQHDDDVQIRSPVIN